MSRSVSSAAAELVPVPYEGEAWHARVYFYPPPGEWESGLCRKLSRALIGCQVLGGSQDAGRQTTSRVFTCRSAHDSWLHVLLSSARRGGCVCGAAALDHCVIDYSIILWTLEGWNGPSFKNEMASIPGHVSILRRWVIFKMQLDQMNLMMLKW